MKTIWKLLITAFAFSISAWAGPLAREQVSSEAKWVLHLDAEYFRTTKLGQYYVDNLLEQQVADAQANLGLDLGPFLHSLKSATAYGTQFGQGTDMTSVLLMQSDVSAVRDIEEFLATRSTKGKKAKLKRLQAEPFALFKLGDLFAAPLTNGILLLSKSPQPIRDAWEILAGKQANAVATKRFEEFANSTNRFVLVAGGDGFSEDLPLPANVKVFRKVENVRAALGERGEQMFLNIALKTESVALAMQMRIVVEGLLAWTAIEKSDDQNLQLLIKSAKVTSAERVVSATFELPAARVIEAVKVGSAAKPAQK